MKYSVLLPCATACSALFLSGSGFAADPESDANVKSPTRVAESNSVPQSVFTIPASAAEGRDPFYPNAHYLTGGTEVKRAPIQTEADLLELKGVSGSADRRLAMISAGGINRTLAVGEEAEYRTANGHLRVRCVDIKGESVVVEVDGERRELRLRD